MVRGRFGERVGKRSCCVCMEGRAVAAPPQDGGDLLGHQLCSHTGDGVTHGAGTLRRGQG